MVSRAQKEILLRCYKIQQDSGFAIKKDFPNLTKRQYYYNVGKLRENGFIENDSQSVHNLKVTVKGKQYLEALFGDLQNNSQYVNLVLDRPNGVTINQPVLFRSGVVPVGFRSSDGGRLHWGSPLLTYGDSQVSVRVTPKTVSYYFKECFSPDPYHAVNVCLNAVFKFSRFLEDNGFKLDLPNTVIVQQEHALYNKELSKFARRYKIGYKSKILTFDMSIAEGEFELISPQSSADDFLRVTDFLEAVASGKITVNSILELQKASQRERGDVKIVNGES